MMVGCYAGVKRMASASRQSVRLNRRMFCHCVISKLVDEVHVSWENATSNGMLQLGLSYQCAIPKYRGLGDVDVGLEWHLWRTLPVGLESRSQAFLEQTGSDPFGASIVTNTEDNPDDQSLVGFFWGLALYH